MQTAPERVQAADDWRAAVARRLEAVDWADIRRDVGPFLEDVRDLKLLTGESLLELLEP